MAITDTATDTPTAEPTAGTAAAAAPVTGLALPAPAGLAGVLGSGDHKTIGRLWIAGSGLCGLASLALLGWYALEASLDSANQTDRAFLNLTLASFGLVLGFVLPLFVGLATLVVPLQVGASTIAFPRAAAAALWTWLLSAVLLAASYLPGLDGGVGGGKVDGSVLTYLALSGLVASILLGTVCVMTTVVTLRPPGMTLDRVPLFSWSMIVAGGIWLLTLPVLVANAAFVVVDLKYGTPSLFGARDLQWTQLSWLLTPPQVFAWAIPALGIAGDAVATFTGTRARAEGAPVTRQPRRAVLLTAIGAFGAVSFGAYVQPAFDPFAFRQWAYIAQVLVLVLPLLAVVAGYGTALRRGVTVASPLVLGLVSLLLLLVGAIASMPFVIGPLDLQTTNANLLRAVPALKLATAGPPVYSLGVFGIVAAGAVTGAVAGLFHWSSKITGRQLPEGAGKLLAPLLLIGGLLLGAPMLILGFANKADGLADSARVLFLVSLVGAALTLAATAAALVLTAAGRAAVVRGAAGAGADAWGTGATLEWAADSPPAPGNFGELPLVTSPEPLLDPAAPRGDGGAR
jgi:heme/copper-type cytochrome/quinol oxidase subunit 1